MAYVLCEAEESLHVFRLQTDRLVLLQTPLEVIRMRLERDDFEADLLLDGGAGPTTRVRFPPGWPGDALVLFPAMAEALADPGHEDWGGTMIDRAARLAVGQMGAKGRPDASGAVEVGYGVNPEHRSRGYGTEMLRGLAAWLLARPEVRLVTAGCLEDNRASIRVLEKAGFARVGRRVDEEGPLILWERSS